MRILIKYPSRGRPERFMDGMKSIWDNTADRDNVTMLVTLDKDDPTINEIRLGEYDWANMVLDVGISQSKIHAVNRGMDLVDHWDIVVVMSDDMRFMLFGWDELVRTHMRNKFPDTDGMLGYYDPDTMGQLNTMYIAGRKYYERRGHIYHPSYKSLFCDNEEMEVAIKLGKYYDTGVQIAAHLNPAYGHLERDKMFDEQQGLWSVDEANYHERRANNFYLDAAQDKYFPL